MPAPGHMTGIRELTFRDSLRACEQFVFLDKKNDTHECIIDGDDCDKARQGLSVLYRAPVAQASLSLPSSSPSRFLLPATRSHT